MTAAIGLATSHPRMAIRGDSAAPSGVLHNDSAGVRAGTNADLIAATYVVAALALVLPYAGHGLALLLAWHRGMVVGYRAGYRAVGAQMMKIADVPVGQSRL